MAAADPSTKAGRNADLPKRAASAAVMLAVAGTALWLGGQIWAIFVSVIALGVLFEWRALVLLIYPPGGSRTAWSAAGAIYCAIAVAVLMELRERGLWIILPILCAVILTDIGAYFAGRTFGGPKIAPAISPSKTWAGLIGGAAGASLVFGAALYTRQGGPVCDTFGWPCLSNLGLVNGAVIGGTVLAVVAQAGDFFESWLKRRAGVKDSGRLIPGHGGLFDRLDGLLAVLFLLGAGRLLIAGI